MTHGRRTITSPSSLLPRALSARKRIRYTPAAFSPLSSTAVAPGVRPDSTVAHGEKLSAGCSSSETPRSPSQPERAAGKSKVATVQSGANPVTVGALRGGGLAVAAAVLAVMTSLKGPHPAALLACRRSVMAEPGGRLVSMVE